MRTTGHPQTSAGTTFRNGLRIGKFHGVMAAIGPIGSRIVATSVLRRTLGKVRSPSRRASPAQKRISDTAR
nr:hypothetical protein [Pseudonocardia nigra]